MSCHLSPFYHTSVPFSFVNQVPRWFPSAGVRCSARRHTSKSSAKWRECSRNTCRPESPETSLFHKEHTASPPSSSSSGLPTLMFPERLHNVYIADYFWLHVFLKCFFSIAPSLCTVSSFDCASLKTQKHQTKRQNCQDVFQTT